jgi:hypothetical protein
MGLSLFIRGRPIRGFYIRTITARVQLEIKSLVVILKGPDAKTN